MTTLANRPNTALIVIDLQNGVVANAYQRWLNQCVPGRSGGVVESKDVDFAGSGS
jgi:hypothetical protein